MVSVARTFCFCAGLIVIGRSNVNSEQCDIRLWYLDVVGDGLFAHDLTDRQRKVKLAVENVLIEVKKREASSQINCDILLTYEDILKDDGTSKLKEKSDSTSDAPVHNHRQDASIANKTDKNTNNSDKLYYDNSEMETVVEKHYDENENKSDKPSDARKDIKPINGSTPIDHKDGYSDVIKFEQTNHETSEMWANVYHSTRSETEHSLRQIIQSSCRHSETCSSLCFLASLKTQCWPSYQIKLKVYSLDNKSVEILQAKIVSHETVDIPGLDQMEYSTTLVVDNEHMHKNKTEVGHNDTNDDPLHFDDSVRGPSMKLKLSQTDPENSVYNHHNMSNQIISVENILREPFLQQMTIIELCTVSSNATIHVCYYLQPIIRVCFIEDNMSETVSIIYNTPTCNKTESEHNSQYMNIIELCTLLSNVTLHVCYYIQPIIRLCFAGENMPETIGLPIIYDAQNGVIVEADHSLQLIYIIELCSSSSNVTFHVCYYLQPILRFSLIDVNIIDTIQQIYNTRQGNKKETPHSLQNMNVIELCTAISNVTPHVCYYFQPVLRFCFIWDNMIEGLPIIYHAHESNKTEAEQSLKQIIHTSCSIDTACSSLCFLATLKYTCWPSYQSISNEYTLGDKIVETPQFIHEPVSDEYENKDHVEQIQFSTPLDIDNGNVHTDENEITPGENNTDTDTESSLGKAILESLSIDVSIQPSMGTLRASHGDDSTRTKMTTKPSLEAEFIKGILEQKTTEYSMKLQQLEMNIMKLENQLLLETLSKHNNSISFAKLENQILKLENELLKMKQGYDDLRTENDSIKNTQRKYLELDDKSNNYRPHSHTTTENKELMISQQAHISELSNMLSNQSVLMESMRNQSEALKEQNQLLHQIIINQTLAISQIMERVEQLTIDNTKKLQKQDDVELPNIISNVHSMKFNNPDINVIREEKKENELTLSEINADFNDAHNNNSDNTTFDKQHVDNTLGEIELQNQLYVIDDKATVGSPLDTHKLITSPNQLSDRESFWKGSDNVVEDEKNNIDILSESVKHDTDVENLDSGDNNNILPVARHENSGDLTLSVERVLEDDPKDENKSMLNNTIAMGSLIGTNIPEESVLGNTVSHKTEHETVQDVRILETGPEVLITPEQLIKDTVLHELDVQEPATPVHEQQLVARDNILQDALPSTEVMWEGTSEYQHQQEGEKLTESLSELPDVKQDPGQYETVDQNPALQQPALQERKSIKEIQIPSETLSQKNESQELKIINDQDMMESKSNLGFVADKDIDSLPNSMDKIKIKQKNKKKKTKSSKQSDVERPKPLYTCTKQNKPKDCYDHYLQGRTKDGTYKIQAIGVNGLSSVYCDMKNGGWTVIQRRVDGTTDFFKNWVQYKEGFGAVFNEHWLGNQLLHRLTNQDHYSLRVDLLDWDRQKRYAHYEYFMVSSEADMYRLWVDGYIGDAGDGMTKHHGLPFSTHDKDNDQVVKEFGGSCAKRFHGAWWYYKCYTSNLNGKYYRSNGVIPEKLHDGVTWKPWTGSNYSLKKVEMKIRPANVTT